MKAALFALLLSSASFAEEKEFLVTLDGNQAVAQGDGVDVSDGPFKEVSSAVGLKGETYPDGCYLTTKSCVSYGQNVYALRLRVQQAEERAAEAELAEASPVILALAIGLAAGFVAGVVVVVKLK